MVLLRMGKQEHDVIQGEHTYEVTGSKLPTTEVSSYLGMKRFICYVTTELNLNLTWFQKVFMT